MLSKNQMVNLTDAQNAARKAIESTYTGVCNIIKRRDVRDEKTKITHKSEEIVACNQPCKLSFERLNISDQTETAAVLNQNVKLFISPDITIKSGSKIIVEQNGVKSEYCASGEPAVYFSHQEIMLELFKEWA